MLTLDTDGRLQRISSPGKHDLTFGYHDVNTIASVTDSVYPGMTTSYGYDPLDRLSLIDRAGGNDQSFQWNKTGNRTLQTREAEGNYDFMIDGMSNRLASWRGVGRWSSLEYDLVGNLTKERRNDGTRQAWRKSLGAQAKQT